MSLLHLFEGAEHEAKPLLAAAAKWAEAEGLLIVKEVKMELAGKTPAEAIALFNQFVAPELGFAIPAGATLTAVAGDLLSTALARSKAAAISGTTLRASVLNAALEQAVLLAHAAAGDTSAAPAKPS